MRLIPLLITSVLTIALIYALNRPWGQAPAIGRFLSPQHGFWQNAEPADQSFNLDIDAPQLKDKVEVYLDERLVPHIFAQNEADAYFVQGYLHAKFRYWQMDFQTRAAAGRISEILGADGAGGKDQVLNFDRGMRRLGMVYAAEIAVEEIKKDPTTNSIMEAYTAGVNHYLENLKESQWPIEYKLLNYSPEKWSFLKTALFLKYMSLDLAGREDDFEMTNARTLFSKSDFDLIYPIIQDSVDPIVPRHTVFDAAGIKVKIPPQADSMLYGKKDSASMAFIEENKPDPDNGSNNWAVAGSKTASGRPILCNDPHLSLNLPSLWFELQIHTPKSNAYGASFPGAPCVVIGFNDSCAWGFTNGMRDVRDYYEIKFKDETRKQYLFNNEWRQTDWRIDTLKIKGRPDMIDSVAYTLWGPVMYDASFTGNGHTPGNHQYAVRWKAHDRSNEMKFFYSLNNIKNYNDYYEAIQNLQVPGQNCVFASKSGDVAIWTQGAWPAKWYRQGDFVMPGTDSTYMWQGVIAHSETPHMVNPERGFVSSANQLPADTAYPYYLGGSYPPYRGLIINRYLKSMSNITPQDMQRLQTENYNVFAEMMRPVLLKNIDEASLNTDEKKYLDILRSWNLRNDPQEKGASVFVTLVDTLESLVWNDEIFQTKLPMKWPDESTLLEGLLRDSAFKFVDNINTPDTERLPQVVTQAFKKIVPQLKDAETIGELQWAKYKSTIVKHLLRLTPFSRTKLNVGGGNHVINATKKDHGPSWRMIVHLTDETEAYAVYPGGQSGNPGSKYYDTFVDTWAAGKYYRLWIMKPQETNDKRIIGKMSFGK